MDELREGHLGLEDFFKIIYVLKINRRFSLQSHDGRSSIWRSIFLGIGNFLILAEGRLIIEDLLEVPIDRIALECRI